ncbi:lytic transglycosylase domain-containing protein [Methylobacterium persicinum]
MPYDFLYRLLRQESGLRADAISPKGALGIAQFMPATALERGLTNPFDPSQAVIKAAELLRDHWVRFGSLGLAAAAYNAGPGRVEKWLAGQSGIPQETRDYVQIVTGRTVEGWAPAGRWVSLERGPDQMAPAGPGWAVRLPMPGALSLHPPAERPTPRLKAGKAGPRSIEARRFDATARSEDELCALVGGHSNACIVRRTY